MIQNPVIISSSNTESESCILTVNTVGLAGSDRGYAYINPDGELILQRSDGVGGNDYKWLDSQTFNVMQNSMIHFSSQQMIIHSNATNVEAKQLNTYNVYLVPKGASASITIIFFDP